VSRDPAHFAIIRSEGDAHGQGIHADAYKTGFSILSAMERSQYLVVVLHGFRALCIYQELMEDRKAATDSFREKLKEQANPRAFTDVEWEQVEPKAWEFLVHKEFEARGLPDFEAVRVRVKKGGCVVLDTRCLHGGAPGDGSPGLRAHAYGIVYVVIMLTTLSRDLQLTPSRKTISPQSTFSTQTTLQWGPGAGAPTCGGSAATEPI